MLKLGSVVVSGTIAPLAIAGSPAAALIVDTNGAGVPNGQIDKNPFKLGVTRVTFSTAAFAVFGTPHAAGAREIGKLRVLPDANAGPPRTPVGPRVSTMRQGVTEKNSYGPAAFAAAGASRTPSATTT